MKRILLSAIAASVFCLVSLTVPSWLRLSYPPNR